MKIQMWSDFRCPFCFVGKRNLEEALKKSNIKAEVEMMSFELDPHNQPDKSKTIYESHAIKFGTSVEKAREMNMPIAERASAVGLNFDMDSVIDSNTFKAHKVLQLAKEKGLAEKFTAGVMSAYFEKGLDIENQETLVQLGEIVGLKKEDILNALSSDDYALKVRQDEQWASSIGVRGVPYFVFDDKVSLSGAQPIETFIEAMTYTENMKKQEQSSSNMCEDDSCNI